MTIKILFTNSNNIKSIFQISPKYVRIPNDCNVLISIINHIYCIVQVESQRMNWNQLSDDDSWNQLSNGSEEQQQKKETEPSSGKAIESTKEVTSSHQVPEPKKDNEKQHQKTNDKKQVKKWPTDQEILMQFEQGKVEDNRRLKIIKCHDETEIQLIQSLPKDKKIVKIRSNKPGFYILTFFNKDDLIKFIKDKIDKKYKFKIAIYIESENEKKWKAEKEKERSEKRIKEDQEREKHRDRENREKKEYKYKEKEDNEKNKEDNKKTFRGEDQAKKDNKRDDKYKKDEKKEEKKEGFKTDHKHDNKDRNERNDRRKENSKEREGKGYHKDHKDHKDHKGEEKDKKIKSLLRENARTGEVQVLSDEAQPSQVIAWLNNQKIPKHFSMFKLYAPGHLFGYMQRLSRQIYSSLNFGLTSEISEQQCQKCPQQRYKYEFSQKKAPKPIKKCTPAVYISKASQQNFDNSDKYNTHIIGEKGNYNECVEFDEKEYVELFKKNYQKIVLKWESWAFEGYGKNVAKVLRLSGTIKRLLTKNRFNYSVGVKDGVSFVRFEICDLNKTKFKVDTSVINNHLQNA